MKQRIAILLAIESVGTDAGTEKYVTEIVARLDRARFDLHLCCLADSPRLRELANCCRTCVFPITRVYTPGGIGQIRALRRYIGENSIDIVHTFMPKDTIAGVLAAKRSPAKVVIASRRNLGYWLTPRYIRLFRYLNRHTTRLLANSEAVKKRIVETEGVSPDRIDVLYNGVDIGRFARGNAAALDALGVPPRAKVVGTVANYRPVKDLPLFLRAARIVADAVPDAVFVLAGKGSLRDDLARLAGELAIAERVFFTDGNYAVEDCLARCSIGCLSSESEGFSNAILEYMAAGLPVVATDAGGNSEAVEDGVTGYIVRRREPEALAAPVIELLHNESGRAAMGRASYDRCRERFEIASAVRRLEDYYASALEIAR